MQAEIKDGEWWENCKYRFKRLIILYACRLAQNYRSKLTNLETELRELQLQAVGNSGDNMKQIKIVKEKISDILRDKFDGAKIPSRAKYLDTEETPSVVWTIIRRLLPTICQRNFILNSFICLHRDLWRC